MRVQYGNEYQRHAVCVCAHACVRACGVRARVCVWTGLRWLASWTGRDLPDSIKRRNGSPLAARQSDAAPRTELVLSRGRSLAYPSACSADRGFEFRWFDAVTLLCLVQKDNKLRTACTAYRCWCYCSILFLHTPQDSLTNDTTTWVLFWSTSPVRNISPFCYCLVSSTKQRAKL